MEVTMVDLYLTRTKPAYSHNKKIKRQYYIPTQYSSQRKGQDNSSLIKEEDLLCATNITKYYEEQ